MTVTPRPMVTEERAVHLLKASVPITVTLSGMVTLTRLLQFL